MRANGAEAAHWLALAERVRSVFDLGADPGEIGRSSRPIRGCARCCAAGPACACPAPGIRSRSRCGSCSASRSPSRARPGSRDASPRASASDCPTRSSIASAGRRLLFPEPDALADAPLEEIGLTRQRARALRALAAAVARGRLVLAPGADPRRRAKRCSRCRASGPWTAELVLLRALGEPDAFPAGDLGLQRALGCDARALERRAERWRPWRAYAAMLLVDRTRRRRSGRAQAHARSGSAAAPAAPPRAARGRSVSTAPPWHDAGPADPPVAERRAGTTTCTRAPGATEPNASCQHRVVVPSCTPERFLPAIGVEHGAIAQRAMVVDTSRSPRSSETEPEPCLDHPQDHPALGLHRAGLARGGSSSEAPASSSRRAIS